MSDRQEKQLEIVLKLNKLTKQGKIAWIGPSLFNVGIQYAAKFRNRSYLLTDSPIANALKPLQNLWLRNPPSEGSKFSLSIREDDEDKEIWISPMPAVDDLASTIRHQIMKGDTQELDEVLKDLEEAENLLEG